MKTEDPCDYGAAEEEERAMQTVSGHVPSFCLSDDELREWNRGIVTEGELRRRHGEVL